MFTERFTFGTHPSCVAAMEHLKASLKAEGLAFTVETTTMTRHDFVLHTLVFTRPTPLHPVKFTRAGGL